MSAIALPELLEKLANLRGTTAQERHRLRDLLMEAIGSGDMQVRSLAAEALGRIGDDRAVGPLTEAMHDPEPLVRWRAGHALYALHRQALVESRRIGIGDERDFESWKARLLADIATMLDSQDRAVRLKAACALRACGAPETLGSLLPALFDKDAAVRAETLQALAEFSSRDERLLEPAVAYLLPCLRDGDPLVRRIAASALGTLGSREAIRPLALLLHDPDAGVRARACRALGNLRDPASVRALVSCLADDDPEVRRSSARALGEVGDGHALAPLRQISNDEHPAVRQAVSDALNRLGIGRAKR
ncbi:MAG: HEAT repeat domain-containing protein [Chloroflexia bacterium]